ncbi:MAG: Uma2 family endonuclease [Pirellulaceae bacterium]|nr:Uma2 family endonuclease [Pirellulaceae bacterium]
MIGVARLSLAIGNAIDALACQAEVIVDLDWIILEDTIVRPDIVVVCGPPPERYLEKSPSIVVEVLSESTRQNDLNYKRQPYRREGVAAFLIVDPEARSIQVDRRQPDGNDTTEISASEIAMRLCEDCEIQFDTRRIFPR